MSDFRQTIDLREKTKKPDSPQKTVNPIEEIYQDENLGLKKDFSKINRPKIFKPREGLIRLIILVLAVIVVGATVYTLFFRHKGASVDSKAKSWYAIKLVDGEVYYGQVFDVKADPIVVGNVYYNYDQAKDTAASKTDLSKNFDETGSIRLIKRGQETHGPNGSMDIIRSQVLFLEQMKAESKVLKAILEYEK